MPAEEEDEAAGGGLLIHAVVYLAVNLLLVALWVLLGSGRTADIPTYLTHLDAARDNGFWPIYVIVCWGAALLIHAGVFVAGIPGRRRRRRERRRARQRLHTSVAAAVDGTFLEGAALAGIRAIDGDKAAKKAKKAAAKQNGKRKKATKAAKGAKAAPTKGAANGGTGTSRAERRRADGEEVAVDGDGSRLRRRASDRTPGRHWVAVLFTDIVESTPLNRALGDDAFAALLAQHRSTVRTCLRDHRGTEVGTQGDGFLVRFDTPDDAAACAVELQRRCRLDRERSGHPLRIRIGIHAGEVVVDDDDVVGQVINLAARVTDAAAADEILVTEPLADHLTASHAIVDRGLRTLKGFDRPRHLLALLWEEPAEVVLDQRQPADQE